MKKNLGTIDQLVRFVIAFIALSLYLADCISGWLALLLLGVLMTTTLFKFCPLYSIFNINTIKKRKRRD